MAAAFRDAVRNDITNMIRVNEDSTPPDRVRPTWSPSDEPVGHREPDNEPIRKNLLFNRLWASSQDDTVDDSLAHAYFESEGQEGPGMDSQAMVPADHVEAAGTGPQMSDKRVDASEQHLDQTARPEPDKMVAVQPSPSQPHQESRQAAEPKARQLPPAESQQVAQPPEPKASQLPAAESQEVLEATDAEADDKSKKNEPKPKKETKGKKKTKAESEALGFVCL